MSMSPDKQTSLPLMKRVQRDPADPGATLGDLDGCLNSAFLGLFYTSRGPSFSGR